LPEKVMTLNTIKMGKLCVGKERDMALEFLDIDVN
jgi:hypothetical protein